MHSLSATSNIVGVADVATRTISQLFQCIETWNSAPREVFELRDNITAFRQLLDLILQAQHRVAASTPSHDTPLDDLHQELISAKETLSQLGDILDHVRGVPLLDPSHELRFVGNPAYRTVPDVPSNASMKTRWLMNRVKTVRLQAALKGSHQRILARLTLLNLCVTVDVFSSTQRQQSTLAPMRSERVFQGLQQGHETAENIKYRAHDITQGLTKSRDSMRSHVAQLSAARLTLAAPPLAQAIDSALAVRPRAFTQEHETRMQRRDAHNEQKFRHLEQVFAVIQSSTNSRGADAHDLQDVGFTSTASSTSRLMKESCGMSCRCKCHNRHTGSSFIFGLSAFKSTFGSFSLVFTGKLRNSCIPSCKSRQPRRLRVTYTYPTWLFHAAVSLSYTDQNSPELILRVINRVPPSTVTSISNIFAYIQRGEIDNVKRALHNKEASILDVSGLNGQSLLTNALSGMKFELAQLLVREGADPLQADDFAMAPIEQAAQLIFTSRYLSQPSRSILDDIFPMDLVIEACVLTDLHKVVMKMTSLDVREYLSLKSHEVNVGDIHNRTPLFYAAASGDEFAVQSLLDAGALPNVSSSSNSGTPLHVACRNRHFGVVQRLIDGGADVNAGKRDGAAPLQMVCCSAYSKHNRQEEELDAINIAATLVRHGANMDTCANDCRATALDHASAYNLANLVEFLVDAGADLNHRDWEGTNALGNAICWNALDSISILLRKGADYRNVEDNGQGVLHLLGTAASAETMEIFIEAGASGLDINLQDNDGKTPSQLFHARDDLTDEHLEETFERLLSSTSRVVTANDDSDSETGEFFDALEM